MADIGTGVTLGLGTSSWTGDVTDVSWDGMERDSIETSHLGTTGGKTFMPGDLYDPGEISIDINFDPSEPPPITAAAEVFTVTFPFRSGSTTQASWAASGFVTGFNFGAVVEGKQTATMTIKLSGDVTWVAEV